MESIWKGFNRAEPVDLPPELDDPCETTYPHLYEEDDDDDYDVDADGYDDVSDNYDGEEVEE